MASDPEYIIRGQRDQWAELVDVDDGTPAFWEELVRRSAAVSTSSYFFPVWEAESSFTPVSYAARGELPAEVAEETKQSASKLYGLPRQLIDEWDAYAERWRQFLDANPKARIATLLSEISESHDASSWPYGWEHLIRDWVADGFAGEVPFQDRYDIDTSAWRNELREAWERAGRGWVFWEETTEDRGVFRWRASN